MLYRMYRFGLREFAGFMHDWRVRKIELPVPSFGHLSDLFAALDIAVRKKCTRAAERLNEGEPVTVIVDSTGLRFSQASAWYEKKYGQKAACTPWRMMHLAMDAEERNEQPLASGVVPVIPPKADAVDDPRQNRWHDQLVRYLKEKGQYEFQNKYGYGLRDRVEAQLSRIKRCLGDTLLTRRMASQVQEGRVIANLVNQRNAFGQARCIKKS
jgi:hypothetical protein